MSDNCVEFGNVGIDHEGHLIRLNPSKPIECYSITDVTEEKINHPRHYHGNTFEAIDIIEDYQLGFNLGNSIKYILRSGKKGDAIEDLKKAVWYLEREISNKKSKNSNFHRENSV